MLDNVEEVVKKIEEKADVRLCEPLPSRNHERLLSEAKRELTLEHTFQETEDRGVDVDIFPTNNCYFSTVRFEIDELKSIFTEVVTASFTASGPPKTKISGFYEGQLYNITIHQAGKVDLD